MCFRCRKAGGLVALLLALAAPGAARVFRVCADPNNLPYSNQRGEGFENRLAELVARDLGARLEYTWWAQRKSFVKHTLDEDRCDAIMGVPSALDAVEATAPYYRSTYVFVSRGDRGLRISSLSDPRLEKWRIGIHLVGDDYAPPAQALARRGLSANLAGYSLFGEEGAQNPPARLVDAVARGDVDVAIIWGPFAGYFAPREKVPMAIAPVSPAMYLAVPFTYEISAGVRKGNRELRDELDAILSRECGAIEALLAEYGVPLVKGDQARKCDSSQ